MRAAAGIALVIVLPLALACARPIEVTPAPDATAVIWREPPASSDQPAPPVPPFRFIEEDFDGDSPKFLVEDGRGMRWQVKLGPEAQAETVAVRLMAATGYFTEETFLLPEAPVAGLDRLKRGREFVHAGSVARTARFEARPVTVRRGETWDWGRNPFTGTRELDGLRTLMVLFNNYDARTANNRVLDVSLGARIERRYVVTDAGASFGRYGGLGGRRTKNDLEGYRASAFIDDVKVGEVHFAYRTRPQGWGHTLFVLNPFYVAGEVKKERDLRRVPVTAARWIGERLAQLPPGTLRQAFDDAGYPPPVAEAYVEALTARIAALTRIDSAAGPRRPAVAARAPASRQ